MLSCVFFFFSYLVISVSRYLCAHASYFCLRRLLRDVPTIFNILAPFLRSIPLALLSHSRILFACLLLATAGVAKPVQQRALLSLYKRHLTRDVYEDLCFFSVSQDVYVFNTCHR